MLPGLAEHAAGDDDRFAGASDDELTGIIAGLDRAEAAACSLKHAAVAELIRLRRNCIVIGVASASLASLRTQALRTPRLLPRAAPSVIRARHDDH